MAPTYPDLKRCHKPICVPPYAKCLDCCPPYKGEEPKRFEFPSNLPMRTRRAAQNADDKYVAKYAKAVQLMKNLPPEDPRNFMQQANVHFAYCNGAYYTGETEKLLNVHGNWFFLPWHRWYLYFHERILATLLGEEDFALPFWNWDYEGGMSMPAMYMDQTLSLFDNKRNGGDSNRLLDLNFGKSKAEWSNQLDLVSNNYRIMHKQIVSLAKSTSAFHGQPFRENSPTCTCGAGTLEYQPHNVVHKWTGTQIGEGVPQDPCLTQTCYGEDMGNTYSAARDPIFYAHHANVDRMWTIWKTLPGRKDYADPDLLDTKFYFYDERMRLVEVRAGDAFDPQKLRYQYEVMPTMQWTEPISDGVMPTMHWTKLPSPSPPAHPLPILDLPMENTFLGPVKVPDVNRNPLTRRSPSSLELLVIEGIRVQRNIPVKFDVFLQLHDDRARTSYVDGAPREYAGTYVQLPRGAIDDPEGGCGQSSMRVVISDVLTSLGCEDDAIAVTLIPKVALQRAIQISAVRIEYEEP